KPALERLSERPVVERGPRRGLGETERPRELDARLERARVVAPRQRADPELANSGEHRLPRRVRRHRVQRLVVDHELAVATLPAREHALLAGAPADLLDVDELGREMLLEAVAHERRGEQDPRVAVA